MDKNTIIVLFTRTILLCDRMTTFKIKIEEFGSRSVRIETFTLGKDQKEGVKSYSFDECIRRQGLIR